MADYDNILKFQYLRTFHIIVLHGFFKYIKKHFFYSGFEMNFFQAILMNLRN